MTSPDYMAEPWFALLQSRCLPGQRSKVAIALGISAPTLSQVLNGSGEYGKGSAGTGRIADRVIHTFGRYPCPHLTAESSGEVVVVTADECRGYAHREPPTGSPRAMQHWQACHQCPHKAASAPPQ
ncbi:hypothetical protein BH10PSE18_BH10PSE18_18850 [soil metagenome]